MLSLTPAETADYDRQVTTMIDVMKVEPMTAAKRWPSPSILVEELIPDHPLNFRLYRAVKETPSLGYTVTEVKEALKRQARTLRDVEKRLLKEAERQAKQQMQQDSLMDVLGGIPEDERTYIALFMASRGYDMGFDRKFTQNGKTPKRIEEISNDAHLTAANLGLTKPRGDILGSANIDRALSEWTTQRRIAKRDEAHARVRSLPETKSKADIDSTFRKLCAVMFAEPEFAEAAIRKFVWAVKRKLAGLPIPQAHMVVILGAQNAGKTELCRYLIRPLEELSAEVSLQDVLDPRQMDLLEYYILFPDELVFADRLDASTLKTFITGFQSARRPMRTNIAEKVQLNATLIGTTNRSLGTIIFDQSGMRRFVEIAVRPRAQIEPHWHEHVVGFDFLGLWQSIDENSDDPLWSEFRQQLGEKQEALRNQDNVEQWLSQFEFNRNLHNYRPDTSSHERVEFVATELYKIFLDWEQVFDRGYRGTNMNRWGREMKSLIDSTYKETWSYRMVNNRKIYCMKLPPAKETGGVVPFKPTTQRTSSAWD